MRWFAVVGGIGALLSVAGMAIADGWRVPTASPPYAPPGCATPGMPAPMPSTSPGTPPITMPGTAPGTQPGTAPTDTPAPTETAGAAAGEAGAGELGSAAPGMIGDLLSVGQLNSSFLNSSSSSSSSRINSYRALLVNVNALKITENESARPQDRVYFNYNYFNNVGSGFPGGSTFDVHRETFGFERTMMDGSASIGARLPILIQDGGGSGGSIDGFGDLSVVFKWAPYLDNTTGNVLSTGMVITAPTGRDITLLDGTNRNPWFFQPYVGGIWNADSFYVTGFTAVIIPSEAQLPTFFTNDIGIGYRLYQSNEGALTSVIPTIEGHLTAPLNHSGIMSGPTGFPDVYDLTAGFHFGLYNRAYLTLAAAAPLTGPRPYDYELIAQINFRW